MQAAIRAARRCRGMKMPKRTLAMYRLGEDQPTVHHDAWVAPNAVVVGKVALERGASVWWGATLRGDNELITVGEGTNVQDGSVLHTDKGFPLTLGKNVTVGHMVMLHGCDVGDGSLIGIGSTILNSAKIGKNCLVGAHTLIPEGKVYPDNSMILGTPGKVVKTLTPEQIAGLRRAAEGYVANADRFRRTCRAVEDDSLGII